MNEPNPALFDEMRRLRKEIADQQGVPPYVVFHDSVLRQMAAQLPANLRQMRTIPGIGERKLTDYGETFLELIAAHVAHRGARPVQARPPSAVSAGLSNDALAPRRPPPAPGSTVLKTLELFRLGMSPAAIAERRGIVLATVEGHLALALESGETLDLNRLVSPEKQQAIQAAIEALGPEPLGTLREHLGEDYTYGEIRYVRAALATTSSRLM